MPGFGDLVATLGMDSHQFKEGLHEGRESLGEFRDHVKEIGLEIAGALGVGFGIEKSVEAIRGQFEQVIELSHLAARTEIDVNDLQALKLEAKECGIEFEMLQRGITKLSVNLTEAAQGGQEQIALFEDLKLNVADLASKLPIDKFLETAEAIAKIEDPTKRVYEAYKVFGKTGAELLEVLERGKGGLAEAKQQLEDPGMAVTPEQVATMERAHESTIKLETALSGLGRTFATDLAPSITKGVEALNKFIAANAVMAGLREKITRRSDGSVVANQPGAGFAGFGSADEILAARARGFQRPGYDSSTLYANPERLGKDSGFPDPKVAANRKIQELEAAGKAFDALSDRGEQLHKSLETPLQKAIDQFEELDDLFEQGIPSVNSQDVLAAFGKIGEEVDRLKQKDEEMRKKLSEPYDEWEKSMAEKAKSISESVMTPLEKLHKKQAELGDLHDKHFLGDSDFDRAMKGAQNDFNKSIVPTTTGSLGALTSDSRELQQQMVDAMRGGGYTNRPAEQTAQATQQMATTLQAIAQNTDPSKDIDPATINVSGNASDLPY